MERTRCNGVWALSPPGRKISSGEVPRSAGRLTEVEYCNPQRSIARSRIGMPFNIAADGYDMPNDDFNLLISSRHTGYDRHNEL